MGDLPSFQGLSLSYLFPAMHPLRSPPFSSLLSRRISDLPYKSGGLAGLCEILPG